MARYESIHCTCGTSKSCPIHGGQVTFTSKPDGSLYIRNNMLMYRHGLGQYEVVMKLPPQLQLLK